MTTSAEFLGTLEATEPSTAVCDRCIKAGVVANEAEFREGQTELMKFLWLGKNAEVDETIPMFSPKIDAIWHENLMFTKEYANSCDEMFGCYMHHNPSSNSNGDVLEATRRLNVFKSAYTENFGDLPAIWGIEEIEHALGTAAAGCELDPVEQCETPSAGI
jgi:hypothetical protein